MIKVNFDRKTTILISDEYGNGIAYLVCEPGEQDIEDRLHRAIQQHKDVDVEVLPHSALIEHLYKGERITCRMHSFDEPTYKESFDLTEIWEY